MGALWDAALGLAAADQHANGPVPAAPARSGRRAGLAVPATISNPALVTRYIKDNPAYGPVLDVLQMFDVYSSVWFSAIYILLFISLIGCVVPRPAPTTKPCAPSRHVPQNGSPGCPSMAP